MAAQNILIMDFIKTGPGGLPRGPAASHPSGSPSLRNGVLGMDPLGFPIAINIDCTLAWPGYQFDPKLYDMIFDVSSGTYQFEVEAVIDGLVDDGTNIYIPVDNLNSLYYTGHPAVVPGTSRYLRAKAYSSLLLETDNIQTWPDSVHYSGGYRGTMSAKRMIFDISVDSVILVFDKHSDTTVKRIWRANLSVTRRFLWHTVVHVDRGGTWVKWNEFDNHQFANFSFRFDYEMIAGDPKNMSPVGNFSTVVFNTFGMDSVWSASSTSFEVVSVDMPS